jgi:hypothetical protein
LNKKTKLRNELTELGKREATNQDCPSCKMHFYSPLQKESHTKLYPAHFKADVTQTVKEEAIPQVKQSKRSKKADV